MRNVYFRNLEDDYSNTVRCEDPKDNMAIYCGYLFEIVPIQSEELFLLRNFDSVNDEIGLNLVNSYIYIEKGDN